MSPVEESAACDSSTEPETQRQDHRVEAYVEQNDQQQLQGVVDCSPVTFRHCVSWLKKNFGDRTSVWEHQHDKNNDHSSGGG